MLVQCTEHPALAWSGDWYLMHCGSECEQDCGTSEYLNVGKEILNMKKLFFVVI